MGRTVGVKNILNYAPSFCSGITSVLMPTKRSKQLYKAIRAARQMDGLYDDWMAVGDDLRNAMDKFEKEMAWQRK